jgi:hypothetical protein
MPNEMGSERRSMTAAWTSAVDPSVKTAPSGPRVGCPRGDSPSGSVCCWCRGRVARLQGCYRHQLRAPSSSSAGTRFRQIFGASTGVTVVTSVAVSRLNEREGSAPGAGGFRPSDQAWRSNGDDLPRPGCFFALRRPGSMQSLAARPRRGNESHHPMLRAGPLGPVTSVTGVTAETPRRCRRDRRQSTRWWHRSFTLGRRSHRYPEGCGRNILTPLTQ